MTTTVSESRAALHDSPIGENGGRRHIAGSVPGKKRDEASDFLRPSHAAQRNGVVQFLKQRGVLHGGKIYWSGHRAGADTDDKDVVRREFDTGGARQHAHAALGEAVGGV